MDDKLLSLLEQLRKGLNNPDTWSLKPLAALCEQAIDLRKEQLIPIPPPVTKTTHKELWP